NIWPFGCQAMPLNVLGTCSTWRLTGLDPEISYTNTYSFDSARIPFPVGSALLLNPLVRIRSVLPSELVAVATAWPTMKSGRVGKAGFSGRKIAPAVAVGVISCPFGRSSPVTVAAETAGGRKGPAPTPVAIIINVAIARVDLLKNLFLMRPMTLSPR